MNAKLDSHVSPVEIVTLPSHLWILEDIETESNTKKESPVTTPETPSFETPETVPEAVPEWATENDSLSTDVCYCENSNDSHWIWLLVMAIMFSLAVGYLAGYLVTKFCAKRRVFR